MNLINVLIPFSGLVSLLTAFYLYRWVAKQKNEDQKMAEFSADIQKGSATYLKRLYQTLSVMVVILTIIIFFALGWPTAVAYVFGSICSVIAGYLGIYVATRANAKVAWAAQSSLEKAFPGLFFRGGHGNGCRWHRPNGDESPLLYF